VTSNELREKIKNYDSEKARALWEEAQTVFTGDSANAHADLGQKIADLGPVGMLWVWTQIAESGDLEMTKNAHRVLITDILSVLQSISNG